MSDLVKITLAQPAKIHGETRSIGWSGEVDVDIFQQLADAGAVSFHVDDEPVLVERATDPRDDLIDRLRADIGELRFQLEVASGSAAMSAKLIAERDQALAQVADLEARIAATEGERDEARERIAELEDQAAAPPDPTPAPAPKKTKAATSA